MQRVLGHRDLRSTLGYAESYRMCKFERRWSGYHRGLDSESDYWTGPMLRCGGIDGMIGPYEYIRYEDPAYVFRAYDDRYPMVARSIADLIGARAPDVRVEHIGSTAVPGCDGRGVVDMMLLYAPGGIGPARDTLDALGFQRQLGGPHAFSEERPVRVGSLQHDSVTFRLHIHVVEGNAPEGAEQLSFRDRLRADSALLEAYVARKPP